MSSFRPQADPAAAPHSKPQAGEGLWKEAAGWRILALGASALTVAAGALCLPVLHQQEAPGAATKPLTNASSIHRPTGRSATVDIPSNSAQPLPVLVAPSPRRVQARALPPGVSAPIKIVSPQPLAVLPSRPVVDPAPTELQPQACTLRLASVPQTLGEATVLGFENRNVSQVRIRTTQQNLGGLIDPAYADNQRVIVRMASGERRCCCSQTI